MHARMSKKEWTKLRTIADEARRTTMRSRASLYAFIAARAAIEIDHHGLLAINEALVYQKLDKRRL